jgi:hypothetical protein
MWEVFNNIPDGRKWNVSQYHYLCVCVCVLQSVLVTVSVLTICMLMVCKVLADNSVSYRTLFMGNEMEMVM